VWECVLPVEPGIPERGAVAGERAGEVEIAPQGGSRARSRAIRLQFTVQMSYAGFSTLARKEQAMKKRLLAGLVLGMIVLVIGPGALAQVGGRPEAVITSNAANFRAGPGLNYDIVGGDYLGARFPVTGRAWDETHLVPDRAGRWALV
jgi:hypothetical protein